MTAHHFQEENDILIQEVDGVQALDEVLQTYVQSSTHDDSFETIPPTPEQSQEWDTTGWNAAVQHYQMIHERFNHLSSSSSSQVLCSESSSPIESSFPAVPQTSARESRKRTPKESTRKFTRGLREWQKQSHSIRERCAIR